MGNPEHQGRAVAVLLSIACATSLALVPEVSGDSPRQANGAAIRRSIDKALPLLEKGAAATIKKRQCFTCHHTATMIYTLEAARRRGLKIDTGLLEALIERSHGQARVASVTQRGRDMLGEPDMTAWALVALDQVGWQPDERTAGAAEFVLRYNQDLPNWHFQLPRPPTAASDFTSTWVSLVSILNYSSRERQLSADIRAGMAGSWLLKTPAGDTEDRVYRLRSLHLLGFKAARIAAEASQLLKEQREDGGWAQKPTMTSDAYATSTTLAALHDTGMQGVGDPAWQKGLRYLLQTQQEDGSWHVKTRSPPFQPFYHSDFPHGTDQFISYSATAWSVYVLLQTMPIKEGKVAKPYLALHQDRQAVLSGKIAEENFSQEQLAFFKDRILPVLQNKCYSCHSWGTTQPKAGLRLDSRAGMLRGGESGPVVVSGKPRHSLLIRALRGEELKKMPPREELSEEVIQDFEKWIGMGAPDPRSEVLPAELRARRSGIPGFRGRPRR
jgi:hypothetical protein